MHNAAIAALGLDARYVALRTTPKAFPTLVRELLEQGGGCSVTRPFKDDAFALGGVHTEMARRTRAVNCISGDPRNPILDNTDVVGVEGSIAELLGDAAVRVARIYGTGGAARAAALAIAGTYPEARIEVTSRSAEREAEFVAWARNEAIRCAGDADVMTPLDLLVWATPEDFADSTGYRLRMPGLHATYDPPPPPPAFDMNYRKGGTSLVKLMTHAGRRAIDGRAMLVHQGAAAFRRFLGVEPPVAVMRQAVEDALTD
jgi:shikimate dehydrogenase